MKYEITFVDIRLAVVKALQAYDGIEVLKYDEPIENSGAFLVQYKESNEDAFTYTILLGYENECKYATVDLVDCDGYGFACAGMEVDSLVKLAKFSIAVKEMFYGTFSDEMIKYNIKQYAKEA